MGGSGPDSASQAPGGAALAPRASDGRSMREALSAAAGGVRRYLFGLCGDWDQAEDIAQEALLRAWANRERFDGRSEVATWVFSIARNCWIDRLRRKRTRPAEEPMDAHAAMAGNDPSPPHQAWRGELAGAIARAVGRLPAEQREALALRESRGLTFRQIGQVLGIPVATAKSRVRYALLKLADDLEPFRAELEP